MGTSPGGRSMILPYQVNDTQQQIEVKAEWTGKQGQLNLSYWYSKYNNDANSLIWQNPYANATTGAALFAGGAGFPTGFGRMGLMPSNDFWQAQATGAWNFTPLHAADGHGLLQRDVAERSVPALHHQHRRADPGDEPAGAGRAAAHLAQR